MPVPLEFIQETVTRQPVTTVEATPSDFLTQANSNGSTYDEAPASYTGYSGSTYDEAPVSYTGYSGSTYDEAPESFTGYSGSTYDEAPESFTGYSGSTYDEAGTASEIRLNQAGLSSGAAPPAQSSAGQVGSVNFTQDDAAERDWRVRVTLKKAAADYLLSPNSPLRRVNGVIFPYTPQISVSHVAKYGQTSLTHSNYSAYFYEGSEVLPITITGDFTAQNIVEAHYIASTINFFRTVSKMFFGKSPLAGTPPPIVYLDGYGDMNTKGSYFPSVPCVLTNFTHTMPSEVDYIPVPLSVPGGTAVTRIPTISTISITLQPVYSRNNIQNNFTLEKFATGALLGKGFI